MTEKSTAIIVHQEKFSAGDMDTGNCIIRQIYSDLICCNRTQTTKIFSAPYNHTVLDYWTFFSACGTIVHPHCTTIFASSHCTVHVKIS